MTALYARTHLQLCGSFAFSRNILQHVVLRHNRHARRAEMALDPRTCTPLLEVTTDLNVHHQRVATSQVQPQSSSEEQWTTALLDCFEDAASCCYGFWCCPCLSCTVSGRMQEPYCLPLCDCVSCCFLLGYYCVPLIVPPAGLAVRLAMRKKYNIKGSALNDMIAACCCPCCSWCQMHRELKLRTKSPRLVNVQSVVSVQPPPVVTQEPVTVDTALLQYRK